MPETADRLACTVSAAPRAVPTRTQTAMLSPMGIWAQREEGVVRGAPSRPQAKGAGGLRSWGTAAAGDQPRPETSPGRQPSPPAAAPDILSSPNTLPTTHKQTPFREVSVIVCGRKIALKNKTWWKPFVTARIALQISFAPAGFCDSLCLQLGSQTACPRRLAGWAQGTWDNPGLQGGEGAAGTEAEARKGPQKGAVPQARRRGRTGTRAHC